MATATFEKLLELSKQPWSEIQKLEYTRGYLVRCIERE